MLLVSYIVEDAPRALLNAGHDVLVESGSGRDQWSMARLDGEALVFDERTAPARRRRTPRRLHSFTEGLEVAVQLGASVYWFHSARTALRCRATTAGRGSPTTSRSSNERQPNREGSPTSTMCTSLTPRQTDRARHSLSLFHVGRMVTCWLRR